MNGSGVNLTLKEEKYIDDRAKKKISKAGWQGRKEKFRDDFWNLDIDIVIEEITWLYETKGPSEYPLKEWNVKLKDVAQNLD